VGVDAVVDWTRTIADMRKLLAEFRAFAMNGNMLDMALGFIFGAAFAKLIESLVGNVVLQVIAVVAGQPDFTKLTIDVNGGQVKYGQFITDLINFALLSFALFLVVKIAVRVGVRRHRGFAEKNCPYCHDTVPAAALICRACGQQLVDELPTLAQAQRLLAEQQAHLRLALPSLPRRRGRDSDGRPCGDDAPAPVGVGGSAGNSST
jgi:large conductance mechanosensitive channel